MGNPLRRSLAADLKARVKQASSSATPEHMLTCLAQDNAVTVRAAAALNPSLSKRADLLLAQDSDERVRLLLARKIADALPGLSAQEEASLRDRTLAVLTALVQDEAVRVRTLLAGVMAQLPDIPHALVMTLAQDSAVCVSGPMLRLSPLLSATDLLALLQDPPHGAAAQAIASRADVPEQVAEMIAASADSDAIRALLANKSAAIRESTLDALIARAHAEPGWHRPLVQRPRLPDHAARALSEIVASHLLEHLAARGDLAPCTVRHIQQRMSLHLGKDPQRAPGDQVHLQAARRLEEQGALDEAALLHAIRAGDCRRSAAMLAVAAGVSLEIVDRAASLRSAKALVSLVWKAGFTMRAGVPVQALLGHIGPAAALTGTKLDGFPITAEELGWQLDFLGCGGA